MNRAAIYDDMLGIEAYRFQGIAQPFPAHFHEYYVIGYVEQGTRHLVCENKDYIIRPGDLLLFGPGDSHGCTQADGGTLDYRSLQIPVPVMAHWMEELTGTPQLPDFSAHVIRNDDASCYLRLLHQSVMEHSRDFEKEETLLLLLSALLADTQPVAREIPPYYKEMDAVCDFMSAHYAQRIYLDQLCRFVGLSKSTLLRAFPRAKGVTPYRYLTSIRISRAKVLLEQGASVLDAAMQTGFSDQSHFTGCFSRLIGLTPGAYRAMFWTKQKDGAT